MSRKPSWSTWPTAPYFGGAIIAARAEEILDLDGAVLGPEYSYAQPSLAVIDAVYSIGVSYASTRNTVQRVADGIYVGGPPSVAPRDWPPGRRMQQSLGDFAAMLRSFGTNEYVAQAFFGNRQRTSTRPGAPLKAEAVRRFFDILPALKDGDSYCVRPRGRPARFGGFLLLAA